MNLLYNIAMSRLKGVGPVNARALIAYFGSAEAVFNAKKRELKAISGIGDRLAESIRDRAALAEAETEVEYLLKHKIEAYFYQDDAYPKRLKQCYDAPVMIYYKGSVGLNHSRIVSIVGTRKATEYGKIICRQLTEALKPHDVTVISGLAYGIDVAVHKKCLNYRLPTIAVLGHGLNTIYPKAHATIAYRMLENGGLLTEFGASVGPDRENFPKRNRLIAGMADAVVVVEASIKGGALITAELANSYNRDVYAFPGRIDDEYSEGCNFIIKTSRAGLINHPDDLIYNLGWADTSRKDAVKQISMPLGLDDDERRVVEALAIQDLSVDVLGAQCQFSQGKLAMLLLKLEMQGILRALPGKVYSLR